jgi:hypothetical protein
MTTVMTTWESLRERFLLLKWNSPNALASALDPANHLNFVRSGAGSLMSSAEQN